MQSDGNIVVSNVKTINRCSPRSSDQISSLIRREKLLTNLTNMPLNSLEKRIRTRRVFLVN